jgi:hypothetical protein
MFEHTGMSWRVPELHRIRAVVIPAESGDAAMRCSVPLR